jgi:hypothetical protein
MGLIIENEMTGKLKEYKKLFEANDMYAKKQVAVALLEFTLSGSSKEAAVPPIDTGMLRGSASVFVANEWIAGADTHTDFQNKSGSGTNDKDIITVGFNVDYAALVHEHEGSYSERSIADGAKTKFLERHIQRDGKTLIQTYADIIKNKLNKGS